MVLAAAIELRTFDELVDVLSVQLEVEANAGIGESLDVIGLGTVERVVVVGVFADNGADDVDGVDTVAGGDALDGPHQAAIALQNGQNLVELGIIG